MRKSGNLLLAFLLTTSNPPAQGANGENILPLADGWLIQSAAETTSSGADVSLPGFTTTGWHPASVPMTVMAALVQDGTYKDIYFGTNLASISSAPFTNAWWYRTEFDVSGPLAAENADLIFEGINYRANVWLNGQRIADAGQTFGAYRIFNLEVTRHLKPGKNILAVELFPPKPGDFTMGFVDWNPKPPDHNMGLFRPVKVHFHRAVGIENVFVASKIDHATWSQAELTISADLANHSTNVVETTLQGVIGAVLVSGKFTLQPLETRTVKMTAADHPELKFAGPKLWWPWELGEPNLYTLKLTAKVGGTISDVQSARFGIREVADYISSDGYRGYMVNGKKILIRGGGWADELLLRESEKNLAAQVHYTKAMNLNTIRLEGVWGSSQRLYDLADENGVLIMVGWSCQWEWKENLGKKTDPKYGGFLTPEDMQLATNYLHDQVCWLRNHPAIYVWVLGSDMLPHPELEKRYDALLPLLDPTRPALKSCSSVTSKVSGPSAVKMNGPYDYVTPNYWYLDTKNGGAFGFNTETGPGPQPPPLETLQRMFPADHLWPIDSVWNFHSGRGQFGQIKRYLTAFNNRYGEATDVTEFAYKSQAANYEAMRAMYEAFAVNLPHTTGIVQWMLNASWPKLYWQLYDYYLTPGGAYFGTKHGAAPVAIIYNYGDQGIYLVNQTGNNFGSQRTTITAYDLDSKIILEQTVTNAGNAYGSQKISDLSKLAPETTVYFLDLKSTGDSGPEASADNFYWLSTKPDVLDEDKSQWFVTPNKAFADFTALDHLPAVTVHSDITVTKRSRRMEATVTLSNESDHLAFFIEMKLLGAKSKLPLTPVFWDDNYISLPPHARKTFHARFTADDMPEIKLQGWNVKFLPADYRLGS